MRKSSWIVLSVCIFLCACLAVGYFLARPSPTTLTQEQAVRLLTRLQQDVAKKNVNDILSTIAPGVDKVANVPPDQLRAMLIQAFRNSGPLRAEVSNIVFQGGTDEVTLDFDLVVKQESANMLAEDYTGHITLHLRRVEVPELLGLLKTSEWRIVRAETTGKDLATFGDY